MPRVRPRHAKLQALWAPEVGEEVARLGDLVHEE